TPATVMSARSARRSARDANRQTSPPPKQLSPTRALPRTTFRLAVVPPPVAVAATPGVTAYRADWACEVAHPLGSTSPIEVAGEKSVLGSPTWCTAPVWLRSAQVVVDISVRVNGIDPS